MNKAKLTTNSPSEKDLKKAEMTDIKKLFSDIGVIIEISDKKSLNNFSDSKRVRIKNGKVF